MNEDNTDNAENTTEFVRRRVEKQMGKIVGIVVLVVTTLFGSFQAVITLPMRVDAAEKKDERHEMRMSEIEKEAKSNREILIRIEEQVRQLRDEIKQRRP